MPTHKTKKKRTSSKSTNSTALSTECLKRTRTGPCVCKTTGSKSWLAQTSDIIPRGIICRHLGVLSPKKIYILNDLVLSKNRYSSYFPSCWVCFFYLVVSGVGYVLASVFLSFALLLCYYVLFWWFSFFIWSSVYIIITFLLCLFFFSLDFCSV